MRLLLRAEADPLLRCKNKLTALDVARMKGHTEIVELLQAVQRGDKSALQDEPATLALRPASAALAPAPAPAGAAGSSAAHSQRAGRSGSGSKGRARGPQRERVRLVVQDALVAALRRLQQLGDLDVASVARRLQRARSIEAQERVGLGV